MGLGRKLALIKRHSPHLRVIQAHCVHFAGTKPVWAFSRAMSGKVLIAEDDLLNSVFYEALFKSADYTTHAVRDGALVLKAVRDFDPDIVLMDINMPNVSGLTLIRRIRRDKALRHKPILAITAYSDPVDRDAISKAGVDGFLIKPARGADILKTCEDILGQAAV